MFGCSSFYYAAMTDRDYEHSWTASVALEHPSVDYPFTKSEISEALILELEGADPLTRASIERPNTVIYDLGVHADSSEQAKAVAHERISEALERLHAGGYLTFVEITAVRDSELLEKVATTDPMQLIKDHPEVVSFWMRKLKKEGFLEYRA